MTRRCVPCLGQHGVRHRCLPKGGPVDERSRIRQFLLAITLFSCLLVFPTSLSQGAGIGCDTEDPCHADEGIRLQIDCTTFEVTGIACGSPPALGYSLLRIAVYCLNADSTGQFTDVHGFDATGLPLSFKNPSPPDPNDSLDLVGGCDNFIAAAHWIRNGNAVQAQCASIIDPMLPDCVSPDIEEQADLGDGFFLYTAILPDLPSVFGPSCFSGTGSGGFSDYSRVEVRNASLGRAYQGVMTGRYMCLQQDNVAEPYTQCDDDGSNQTSNCKTGQCGMISAFNVAPQSHFFDHVNQNAFDVCCDHEVRQEIPGQCNPADCSSMKVQCNSAAVFGACRDGAVACASPGATFLPLSRVSWFGPVADLEPGDSGFASSALSDPCFKFSFQNTLIPEERRVEDAVTFGEATPMPSLHDGCSPVTGDFLDEDFDGVYDACDPVLFNSGMADGLHQVALRSSVRRDVFFTPFNPNTDQVTVGGEPATVIVEQSDSDTLVFTVPQLQNAGPHTITVVSEGNAPQDFVSEHLGYVSNGTTNGLLVVDVDKGQPRDANSSPTNSYINLDCDDTDNIVEVGAPVSLATRSGPVGPSQSADGEVFFLSDVMLDTAVTETRLFGLSTDNNQLLDPTGIVIPGLGRALDVEDDASGDAQAYIARFGLPGQSIGALASVNVHGLPSSWSVNDNLAIFPGAAVSILAHRFADNTVRAYITSVRCIIDGVFSGDSSALAMGGMTAMAGPGGPGPCPIEDSDCGPGGGGGGGGGGTDPITSRTLFLTEIDVTDLANTVTSIKTLSAVAVICDSFTEFENMGMALTSDESTLLIANPANNTVEVFDTATGTLGMAIPVGNQPVDVAIVKAGGLDTRQRAYVLNQIDHSIHVINVDTGAFETLVPIELSPTDPTLRPVAIAARSDGLLLFTADGAHGTITVVSIDPNFPLTENTRVGDIGVGGVTQRLELLRIPGS